MRFQNPAQKALHCQAKVRAHGVARDLPQKSAMHDRGDRLPEKFRRQGMSGLPDDNPTDPSGLDHAPECLGRRVVLQRKGVHAISQIPSLVEDTPVVELKLGLGGAQVFGKEGQDAACGVAPPLPAGRSKARQGGIRPIAHLTGQTQDALASLRGDARMRTQGQRDSRDIHPGRPGNVALGRPFWHTSV